MNWHLGRLAAFDIETTGVDCEIARIVTAAISVVGDDRPAVEHAWLANPGIEIPQGATDVHGISTEQAVTDGRDAAEVVEEITSGLVTQAKQGVPIVAFNARFDLSIVDREARRYELEPLVDRVGGPEELLVIDPLVIDKQYDRFRRGKRTLGAICEHYGIPLEEAHAANADAIAAARVAWKQGQTFAELAQLDLRELHELQITWAAEQAASLQEYFRGQGRSEYVEPAWPIIPFAATPAVG